MAIHHEQIDLTLPGLRRHYDDGDFSPRELVACLRERAQQYRDRNIWIHELTAAELEPYLAALDGSTPAELPLTISISPTCPPPPAARRLRMYRANTPSLSAG